jgi:hypothetical protein
LARALARLDELGLGGLLLVVVALVGIGHALGGGAGAELGIGGVAHQLAEGPHFLGRLERVVGLGHLLGHLGEVHLDVVVAALQALRERDLHRRRRLRRDRHRGQRDQ